MKLMTKEIEQKLPALYTNEKKKAEEVPIIVKFFCPWNQWAWYVTEGDKEENGDWRFFGHVHGDFPELGYFMLSQLEEIQGPLGMKIEQDMYFSGHTLAEAMEKRV